MSSPLQPLENKISQMLHHSANHTLFRLHTKIVLQDRVRFSRAPARRSFANCNPGKDRLPKETPEQENRTYTTQ